MSCLRVKKVTKSVKSVGEVMETMVGGIYGKGKFSTGNGREVELPCVFATEYGSNGGRGVDSGKQRTSKSGENSDEG